MDQDITHASVKMVTEDISEYLAFYQSQGLKKEKALELALKSIGIDCEVNPEHMKPDYS